MPASQASTSQMGTFQAQGLKQAVVIGASFSGLCAARVLSEFFERVLILEKDPLDETIRRGVPQYLQSHVLLGQGFQQLTELFPDLEREMLQQGAHKTDIGTYAHWYQWGGWKRNMRTGVSALSCSRALLETTLRKQVEKLQNVQLLPAHKVLGLLSEASPREQAIHGLKVQTPQGEQELSAQLVIDCSGRGSHVKQWLVQLGFVAPKESEIPAKVGYVTCRYRFPSPDPLKGQALVITPAAPAETRAGMALPIEDDQWSVTLAGWCSDHPEPTPEGILKFAQSLPVPDLHQVLLTAEPLTDPLRHLIPSSIRKHFEKLKTFPRGLLVMGDALCSFNPTYGQGITVGVLEAQHLHDCLSESQGDLRDLWRWFFKRIQPVLKTAWSMVELEDSRFFPEHTISPMDRVLQRYLVRMQQAATRSEEVAEAFYRVLNMIDPPQALFHPRVLWRVLLRGQKVSSQAVPLYQRSSRL
ncbi:FAD-dependent oxidoreductase [Deinococcus roseus]|nr:FAD-dependent monooxygenase [Deinococcus roseus]